MADMHDEAKRGQIIEGSNIWVDPKVTLTDGEVIPVSDPDVYVKATNGKTNLNTQRRCFVLCFSCCSCGFHNTLIPPLPEEASKSSKFASIVSGVKLQLQSLMEKLNTTKPHFIRCAKPNDALKPAKIENSRIIQQLKFGDVLQAIKMSCAGYPTRCPFDDFLSRFGVLSPEVLKGNFDDKAACRMILDKMGLKGYQIGKKKVFLKVGQMAELEARKCEVLENAARAIQRQFRTFIECRKARKIYEQLRRETAALKTQKDYRAFISRQSYLKLRSCAILLQTGLRAMMARNEFRLRKQMKASTIIQAYWRRYQGHSYYKSLQKAAIISQRCWRCRVAQKELRKLRMAEARALKEAKDKLEKRVEEVIRRLQLEKRQRTDLEAANAQEISKLEHEIKYMHLKAEDAHFMVIKERSAARKAIEEAHLVSAAKIQNLEARLITEAQGLTLSEAKNSKLTKKLEDLGKEVDELRNLVQRLKEKLSKLESENQSFRQHALSCYWLGMLCL